MTMLAPSVTEISNRRKQQLCITDPQASVWVEASAGSGKTKALTDRVLALWVHGVDPTSIVCLTFTKAAAAEMRQRILDRMRGWAALDPAALQDDVAALLGCTPQELDSQACGRAAQAYERLLDAPDVLTIETLHAFCARLLQTFPQEAGLPIFFDVLEPEDEPKAWKDALNLVTAGLSSSCAVREALEHLSALFTPVSLCALIQEIYGAPGGRDLRADSMTPEQRRSRLAELCQVPESFDEEGFLGAFVSQEPMTSIDGWIREQATVQARFAILVSWNDAQVAERRGLWPRYRDFFLTKDGTVRKSLGASKKEPMVQQWLATEAERVYQAEQTLQRLAVAKTSWAINEVFHALAMAYERWKDQRGLLDHDDLIVRARALLTQSDAAAWILYKLDRRLAHILVDEAQDTSLEQWALLAALTQEFFAGEGSHPHSLFVVGDRKQSIYGFQGANVAAFHAYKMFFARGTDSFHDVVLQASYRSVPEVLRAVDAVASLPEVAPAWLGLHASEGCEPAKVHHPSQRAGQSGGVELWPLVADKARESSHDKDDDNDEDDRLHPRESLAQTLAVRLSEWLADPPMLPSRGRPLLASDIMVLVRQRGPFVEALRTALVRCGVPVCDADRFDVGEALCNRDFRALCEWIVLPEDDFALALVLTSPLFGMTQEQLLTLAEGRGETSLWIRVQTHYPLWAAALASYREDALRHPPLRWMQTFLAAGARTQWVEALGEACHEALDQWLDLVAQHEACDIPTLQNFVLWYAARGPTLLKREMSESATGVRILTVHGAKGLQAPVVILADTTQAASQRASFVVDPEEKLIFWGRADQDVPYTTALREHDQRLQEAEHLRILYVAMTRAEDHLIVTGWKNRQRLPRLSWFETVERALRSVDTVSAPLIGYDTALPSLPAGFEWQTTEGDPQLTSVCIGHPLVPRKQECFTGALAQTQALEVSHQDCESIFAAPTWLQEPIAPPRSQTEEPATAARTLQRERGTRVHALLNVLASTPRSHWERVAVFTVGESDARELLPLAASVIDRWPWMFGENSAGEVPLCGRDRDGRPVVAYVDRLVRTPECWWILDFKTGVVQDPPPEAYVQQLSDYAHLLSAMAPSLKAALVWIDAECLMPVPLPHCQDSG